MLKLSHLTKTFHPGTPDAKTALDDLSLDVRPGDFISIIGANGAGKSTLFNAIAGSFLTDAGKILLDGQDVTLRPEHKRARLIGRLFQDPMRGTAPGMTVEENLEMGAYTRPNSSIEGNLEHVYELFPRLKERSKQISGTLSGGEQQMLAMGRAMMSEPKLLMLDEPSMGLAPILVEQIFDIIRELHKAGATILLVEQNAQMALQVANRAYVLETGKITLSGSGKELLESDSIKKAYLGG